jgi:hypothetical protein
MVQMISNENLHAINNIPTVRDFVRRYGFSGVNCDGAYILYNQTFAIIIFDALADDGLEILLLNLKTGLRHDATTIQGFCTESGILDIKELLAHRKKPTDFEDGVFLSHGKKKTGDLYDAFISFNVVFPHLINTSPDLAALGGKVDPSWMRPYLECIEAAKNKCLWSA